MIDAYACDEMAGSAAMDSVYVNVKASDLKTFI